MKKVNKQKTTKELTNFLESNLIFREKCHVIYFMVEARKILDHNEDFTFPAIRLYCNWTLHIDLKNDNTTKFISEIFDKYIDPARSGREIARDLLTNNPNFFKLNDFNNELKRFLKTYRLPLYLVNSSKSWISFIKLFLEIIEENPVICISSSKKIDKLELIKDKDGQYCYKFNLKHGGRPPVIKLKFNS